MKLTIERSEALRGLSLVTGIAARKSTIPILTNVLLDVRADGLRITATDMSIEATTFIPAKVESIGVTTVQGDKLLEIVKSLPEGADLLLNDEDDLESQQPPVIVKAGRSRFKLPSLSPVDFPRITEADSRAFSVKASDLAALIDDSAFAADKDAPAEIFKCIYLHTTGDKLRSVGLCNDGLAMRDIDAPDEAIGFEGEMIDLTHAAEIRKLLASVKGDEMVAIASAEGRVSFTIGATKAQCLAFNGQYAVYQNAIDRAAPTHKVIADVDLLTGALRRALIMQTERVRMLKLTCVGGVLSIQGQNMQMGESVDAIDVDVEGGDFNIKVHGPQMIEVLGHIRTENVSIALTQQEDKEPKRPIVLLETGEPRSFFISMPMVI